MTSQTLVALGSATLDGSTLFAHARPRQCDEELSWLVMPGRAHALGEKIQTLHHELPQVRQTCAVLGYRPTGQWGYTHGVNEHRLAGACASWHSKLTTSSMGLTGTELLRLALERGHNAHHALEIIADLLDIHGQCTTDTGDAVFLLADPREALVIESAGPFWTCQELTQARVVGDLSVIRQDWDHIAPGLANFAIHNGWWLDNGTKLDFGAIGASPCQEAASWQAWGQATRILEEQNGRIDPFFLRHVLHHLDHFWDMERSLQAESLSAGATPDFLGTVTRLSKTRVQEPVWIWIGSRWCGLYMPLFLQAVGIEAGPVEADVPPFSLWWDELRELDQRLRHDVELRIKAANVLTRLQEQFDQETADFLADVAPGCEQNAAAETCQRIGLFLAHLLEELKRSLDRLEPQSLPVTKRNRQEFGVFIAG